MSNEIIDHAKSRMDKAVVQLKHELASLRAGRANPALLDKVMVEYYGTPTPVNQIASVSTPEPRLLVIQPWDKNILSDVERAISKSELGLTPNNDGSLIRINIPALTEERRQELVKLVKKYGEEAKVSIRNVRRDANDSIKKQEKDSEITEDESRRDQERVQKVTDDWIAKVDQTVQDKENEMMEV